MKFGDRCKAKYVVWFFPTQSGDKIYNRTAIGVTGVFLGYTYKQIGKPKANNNEWVGGFYNSNVKVAVMGRADGTRYRLPVYVLPADLEAEE